MKSTPEILAEAEFALPAERATYQRAYKGKGGRLYPFVFPPPYARADVDLEDCRNLELLAQAVHGKLAALEEEEELMWAELRSVKTPRVPFLLKRAADVKRFHQRWEALKKLDEEGFDGVRDFEKMSVAMVKVHRAWAARRMVRTRYMTIWSEL
uniref:Uncharacterized protein n=1 Tax=Mycena chlorophos TaxID=658473 RepID=A0ABQ0M484_MYCCL|nr:predicted protein [Mycena chlorophos]